MEILDVKSKISKMKELFEMGLTADWGRLRKELRAWMEMKRDKSSNLNNREEKGLKNKQILSDLWDNIKQSNMNVIREPNEIEKKN